MHSAGAGTKIGVADENIQSKIQPMRHARNIERDLDNGGIDHNNYRRKAMADNSTTTITATFETRASADLAVEHLVQQHGISRPDIFVQARGDRNTAGSAPSGGDLSRAEGDREDAALEGEIEVSIDVASEQIPVVQRSLGDAGALRVSGR
jgi:hypothetical protein